MKTKECSAVLQLMDKDYSYSDALEKVLKESNPKNEKEYLELKYILEEELNLYI